MKMSIQQLKQSLEDKNDPDILEKEDLQMIGGGDKEYKPIYDEAPKKNIWSKGWVMFHIEDHK